MEGENLIYIAARATFINFKYSFLSVECRVMVSLGCFILRNSAIVRVQGMNQKITRGNLIKSGKSKKILKSVSAPETIKHRRLFSHKSITLTILSEKIHANTHIFVTGEQTNFTETEGLHCARNLEKFKT